MNKFRRTKKLSIWILLLTQILLILSYFHLRIDPNPLKQNEKISFVNSEPENKLGSSTYHTTDSRIQLKTVKIRDYFMDFNSSLCYVNGTDIASMKKSDHVNWQCSCLPGWHGKDCGQPEVIWRAFLTYRKSIKVQGPRTFERRIIYIFETDEFSETMTEIKLNELGSIVDLFVIYEISDHFQRKLDNGFVRQYHEKILYTKESRINEFWKSLDNIKGDDIILVSNKSEIPNKLALNYLKLYDKWPEPIRFRLRWSVFGFFWVHPKKTAITGGACSFSYLKENLNSNFRLLNDNKTLSSSMYSKGIIFGDLNHYGGWYCEYCHDSVKIVEYLTLHPQNINLSSIGRQKIDSVYIEDLIENGLYIDGRTELVRARRYHDNYFAPFYVAGNDFKYDFLLINFYSKIDYYEG